MKDLDDFLPDPEYIDDQYRGADKLAGKRALISGGDSGIGRAVALHFAREGARVAIIYHSADDKAEETRRGLEAEGAEALVIRADLSDRAACDRAIRTVVDTWGGIDVLVNNAGMQKPYDDLVDVDDDDWRLHFAVNIDGIFYLSRAALPHMAEGTSIINTSSVNAFVGNDTLLPYTTTKGAIVSFTRALAKQQMGRIRVNEVAPGPINTDIQSVFADFDEDILKNMAAPMGRVGQPREVAPAYVFLASRDGSFVTGQTLHVNGGMICNG
ncbi:short-chain dehydrogenase [Salipiger aestuarii]|jgi:NAD(P)-dependent dehydrogenase (short-subunit alcohol dehydrogenase family)|uniref:NAD(P)-dependent dehydrogenase (Short-subunit alcohol dehydrogenase family) n=1 Tax=Salipiger aestuarii TaxID=568098 RepID=A0A327YGW1_9RHOB|nr:SDR family oxidoreductase [Salipiger aestuarii]KAA8608944.1 short-chain dehydrogenase [Salipiger aestuarii]KAB2542999.1 short-chain dehydrogenase [Salipiger aestuarii]RAK19741.1 NAD(P)-dependent dehydrogenase (short-subunit alcohol dehydrogenase family) [Salipiger aestuarii]